MTETASDRSVSSSKCYAIVPMEGKIEGLFFLESFLHSLSSLQSTSLLRFPTMRCIGWWPW